MAAETPKAEVLVGLGQGSHVDIVRTAEGGHVTQIRTIPYWKPQAEKLKPLALKGSRAMHQSTLNLEDGLSGADYTTTHKYFYSGKNCKEDPSKPLVIRQAQCSSQHHRSPGPLGPLTEVERHQSYSREVFAPKEVIPRHLLHSIGLHNRNRSHEGKAMREVTNPLGVPENYDTTYCSVHHGRPPSAGTGVTGHPTPWHTHDIITAKLGAVPVVSRCKELSIRKEKKK
ncbi:uncharacterized protein LOC120543363 [Polypterus senegalus]|uniref:uncharacterized protein LOC120543363 n=1 Tax=Polypterus senegalus TaxID=55291 RepID=UPI001962CFA1|nr:uncharacterized protein LOC120543363 [Polypterus senegalus]